MKISKNVYIEQEYEFELSVEDINLILDNSPDSNNFICEQLNHIFIFLTGISDKRIKNISPKRRQIISEFFLDQSRRFKQTTNKPGSIPELHKNINVRKIKEN